jgi:hypothetical protein
MPTVQQRQLAGHTVKTPKASVVELTAHLGLFAAAIRVDFCLKSCQQLEQVVRMQLAPQARMIGKALDAGRHQAEVAGTKGKNFQAWKRMTL